MERSDINIRCSTLDVRCSMFSLFDVRCSVCSMFDVQYVVTKRHSPMSKISTGCGGEQEASGYMSK
ncbi:MAG: hypothetical protein PVG37_00180 [Desulfobacterales bacterium]